MIINVMFQIRGILFKSKIFNKRSIVDGAWLRQFGVHSSISVEDSFIITKWQKPQVGWVKLNIDGCAKGNPGEAAGGSIVRSDDGRVLWGQYEYYGNTTNMVSEAKALLQGINLCIHHGKRRVEVEVDSQVLKHVIEGKCSIPWRIHYDIRQIRELLASVDYRILHTFQESNMAADYLANLGVLKKDRRIVLEKDFPRILRGIVRIDRIGLPNVRIKRL